MSEDYSGINCYSCGKSYGSPCWIECVVPDDVWAQISPTGDEGGILCVQCIANRLNALDLRSTCKLTAGRLRTNDKHDHMLTQNEISTNTGATNHEHIGSIKGDCNG